MTGFFESILNGIYSVVHNYGLTLILFTLFIRLVLMPLDYRSRKGMRKMTAVSAKTAEIQKKYANDKEKMNKKVAELYKKEGVSPMSGCIPMLIQWPILLIMFGAMRSMTNQQTVKQLFEYILNPVNGPAKLESFLSSSARIPATALERMMCPPVLLSRLSTIFAMPTIICSWMA